MRVSDSYSEFEADLIARHHHPMTSTLSTAGDLFLIGSLIAVSIGRRNRIGMALAGTGLDSAVVAHLFQPGTLKDELHAIVSHPLWAAKAEQRRVFSR